MGSDVDTAKSILDLGVPGILLILVMSMAYGFIYFFKYTNAKLDEREDIIRNIQNEYIEKVQELMQKQIDSVGALVKTIENNNSSNKNVSNKLEKLYNIIDDFKKESSGSDSD